MALREGHPVKLTDIGTLAAYEKQETKYRHPATGALRTVKPRKALRLFTSPSMRKFLGA